MRMVVLAFVEKNVMVPFSSTWTSPNVSPENTISPPIKQPMRWREGRVGNRSSGLVGAHILTVAAAPPPNNTSSVQKKALRSRG